MSQQNGLSSSSAPVAGRLAHPTQGMRSDSTKPSRPSSASRTSVGSGGITRQGSTGQVAGAVRSGRLSLGASGTLSGRPSAAQGSSSTAAGATASVLTSAAPTAAAGSAAAPAAAPRQSKTTVAAQPTPAAAAGEALTPVPPSGPRPVVFENKLYGEDVPSFTPTVNKGYTGKLSPQMDELQQKRQAKADAAATEASTAPSAAATAAAATTAAGASETGAAAHSIAFSKGRPIGRAVVASYSSSSSKPPVPQHFLHSTGDLFTMPDQNQQQEPQNLTMADGQLDLINPPWNQSRPWLTGTWLMQRPEGFMQEAGTSPEQQLPPLVDLATATPIDAEALLVDDLLTVMMGQAGQFIKHALVEAGTTYPRLGLWVQGVPDPSLQEQVERMLPLCEAVYVIKRFVETRSQIEHPMVMQALAAAMRKLQEEWWVLVVQLEHQQKLGQLNLAALLYYCQAPAASLALLASIAGEAASIAALTSAGLLNLLVAQQRSLAGDRAGQQLVGQLLEAAAEPYFGILRQWLCSGVLDDPYNEFMVKKDDNVKKDSLTPLGEPAYWSMRYTIRRGIDPDSPEALDVPVFLASSVDAILVTGKYLNVIRECGQPVPPCPNTTLAQLRYDAAAAERGSPPWLSGIQAALSAAAGALLAHMAGPQGRLLSWLYCLKHVFLLDQGDFLVHLMEQGDAESSAPLSSLAPHQLQGLLDAALRSSSVAASPHIGVITDGVLSIKVDKRTIVQLVLAAAAQQTQQESSLRAAGDAGESGWQHLMLSLNLSWPINLVVGKRQLQHYQAIFRQLVSLKHTEKELGYAWQALRATKRMSKSDQVLFRPWHLLCSQLMHVVVEVLRYTTIDVLEPLWADMHSRLQQAGNMDEVIQLHNAFLSTALDRSLLPQTVIIVQPLHQLLSAAQTLSNVLKPSDVTRTASSDDGGGNSSSRRGKTAQHHLQALSRFCNDANSQHQLGQLQHLVRQQLDLLLNGLDSHYKQLGQAPLASSAASFTAGGDVGQGGQWGSRGVAAVGDSSRELASLHNLIERLRLAEPSPEALMA